MKMIVGLGNPGLHDRRKRPMKMIVGLGNPGLEYRQTRHNVGFRVVDAFAEQLKWRWSEQRSRAILASGAVGVEKVVLVKPLTYMNLSGEAVGALMRWYKLPSLADLLVVCDDLDLPVGKVRLRPKGKSGGQKGLENIIHHLHTPDFPRLRVGIGRPTHSRGDPISYVLGIPGGDERILLQSGEEKAAEAIPLFIKQGLEAAMNVVNLDPEAIQRAEERRRQQQERREQERLRREAEQEEQGDGPQPFSSNGGESR